MPITEATLSNNAQYHFLPIFHRMMTLLFSSANILRHTYNILKNKMSTFSISSLKEETFYLDITSTSLCGRITKIIKHYGGCVVSDLEGKVSKVITNKTIHANAKKILSSRLESSKKAEIWMRLSPHIRRALKRKIPICTAKSFVNEMRQAHLSMLNQSSVTCSNSEIRDCTGNVQLQPPFVKILNKKNNCDKPRYTQFRVWPVIRPKIGRTRHMRKHGRLSHFHYSKLKGMVPTFRLKRLPNGLYVPLQRKRPPLKLKIFRCRICKKLLADEEEHVVAKSHVQAVKSAHAWNELDKATEDIPNIVSYLTCEALKSENNDLKVPSSESKVSVNETSESNDNKGDVFDEYARRPASPILQLHSIEEIEKVTGFIMPGLTEEDVDMFNKLELIRKKVEMEIFESPSNSSSTFDIIDKVDFMQHTVLCSSPLFRGTYYRVLFGDFFEERSSPAGTSTLETTHTSTLTEQDANSVNSNAKEDSCDNDAVVPGSRKRSHGSNDVYDWDFSKKKKPSDVENHETNGTLVKCEVKTELVDDIPLESSKECNRNVNDLNFHELADTSVEVIDLTSELHEKLLPLDEQIEQFFLRNAEPEWVTQNKLTAVKKLANCVKDMNGMAKVYIYGSTLSKVAIKDSDIDLCIIDDTRLFSSLKAKFNRRASKGKLYRYRRYFWSSDCVCPLNALELIDATVPILTAEFKEPYYFKADISIDSHVGIRSSLLIRHYAMADERFAKLGVLIKCWAKKKFPGGAKTGYIGGFAWTLLLLNYMQCGMGENCPPVFPSFQERYPSLYEKSLDELDLEGKLPENFVSPNKQSLSSLLCGFFYFCANTVDFRRTMLSVRKASILLRQPEHAHYFMYIENPISLKNVARSLQQERKYKQIEAEIKNAHHKLVTTSSVNSLFE
ncbi:Poly(A) RNA polymerase GLD2-B [Trichinella pseudospiralis]|uniref:Poly(A) RNA polymerase GLD2-B n=1 Tax=Trichinella pseudospiralis TaxID=6337 RepID=A0A0V1ICJ9_TRIPS|nr:Poly(A) RNA polymerase GLD2-B [Trichinella pseudospiralis]